METPSAATPVVRQPIKYWPTFASLRPWTMVVLQDHYWRVSYYMEPEDLLHEAYQVFQKLCWHYPRVNNAAWFARLYQRSLVNRIHDLATKASRAPRQLPVDLNGAWLIPEPSIDSPAEMMVLAREVLDGSEAALESLIETATELGLLPANRDVVLRDVVERILLVLHDMDLAPTRR